MRDHAWIVERRRLGGDPDAECECSEILAREFIWIRNSDGKRKLPMRRNELETAQPGRW